MAEGRDSSMHPSWFTGERQLSFHLVYILSSLDQFLFHSLVPSGRPRMEYPNLPLACGPSTVRSSIQRHPSKHTILAPPIGCKLPLLTSKAKLNKGWNVDRLVKLSQHLWLNIVLDLLGHTHLKALYCHVLLHRMWMVFLCQSTSWSVGWLPG